jgi:putative spermidine/putrescine transport system ATP-binding protein
MLTGDQPSPPGANVEAGRIRDVVYAGVLTRFIVDLDAGGELVVARQNTEAPVLSADGPGTPVRLAWRPDQAFAVSEGQDQDPGPGEG